MRWFDTLVWHVVDVMREHKQDLGFDEIYGALLQAKIKAFLISIERHP